MPSKRATRLKRRKQKRWEQLPKAKPPLVPDESAVERRGMEIFLRQTAAFRLALALYNDPVARDETIRSLQDEMAGQGVRVLTLDLREPALGQSLLARVETTVKEANLSPDERLAMMVVNLESQVDYSPELAQPDSPGTEFLRTANLHRELFPGVCPGPLVMWMTELLERAIVSHAPDLWHWRSHTFDLRVHALPSDLSVSANDLTWSSNDFRRHPKERLRLLEEELVAYRKAGASFNEGRILNGMGTARLDMGDARNALRDFEAARSIAHKLGDRLNEGATLVNLGNVNDHLGNSDQAIKCYEQALALAREVGDRPGEGAAYGNLGAVYNRLLESQRAIECHEQALTISREVGDRRSEGKAINNLGIIYSSLGELHQAIKCYEQALVLAREVGDRRSEGNILGNLGVVYKNLGETSRAVDFHQQALTISLQTGDQRGEGMILGNLGIAYFKLGKVQQAIEFHQKRLVISQEIGDQRSVSESLYNAAVAFAASKDYTKAVQLAEQASNIMEVLQDVRLDRTKARLATWRKMMQNAHHL